MERFVVGVDGSDAAAAALRWAGELAARTGAEIVAVHALEYPFAEVSPEDGEKIVADRKSLMSEKWIRPAVDAGASVRTEIRGADPRKLVLEVAETQGADLVVLGRTGHDGGPGFLHLGSVVEYAAHHTRKPLAVIPSDAGGTLQQIILGVEGSSGSLAAIEWCAALAPGVDAKVIAVAVELPLMEWTPSTSPKNWRHTVELEIDAWTSPLKAVGVAVESLAVRDPHPADGLLDVASQRGGDLLIIGTRGAGGFIGLRAGGVTMKVLHRASLPLVLVPPPS